MTDTAAARQVETGPWANSPIRTARKEGQCDYWLGVAFNGFGRAARAILAMKKDDPRAVDSTTQLLLAMADALDQIREEPKEVPST